MLFTTTPHPERAATATLKDIESEMTVLYKILGATMDIATRSSQMVGIIEEMRRASRVFWFPQVPERPQDMQDR